MNVGETWVNKTFPEKYIIKILKYEGNDEYIVAPKHLPGIGKKYSGNYIYDHYNKLESEKCLKQL